MDRKQKRTLYLILYILIFAITSAPVFCGYVMEGGDGAMWLGRMRELRESLTGGAVLWFPTPELVTAFSSQSMSFDNGLWLFSVALLQMLGVGEQMAYCIFTGLIGIATLGAAYWMMRAFFENRATALFGVLFYMSCPYRIYICFDKADLGQSLVWALMPLLVGGLARLCQGRGREVSCGCVAAAAYAGIWYADARWGVIIGGCAALYLIFWARKPVGLLFLAGGAVLSMPVILYLARYLIKGGMEVWDLPLDCIMANGYTVGYFMTNWAYRPDMPGLGMALAAAFLLLIWLYWSGYGGKMQKAVKGLLLSAGVLTVMSLKIFPWDFVQRVGAPFLRFVGLLETPGVFWMLANMVLTVPAAWTMGEIRKKQGNLWQWAVPAMLLLIALATALYLCNSLTYTRLPLGQSPICAPVY